MKRITSRRAHSLLALPLLLGLASGCGMLMGPGAPTQTSAKYTPGKDSQDTARKQEAAAYAMSEASEDERMDKLEADALKAQAMQQVDQLKGQAQEQIKDIQKHVVDKGLSKADKAKVGEQLYNRGVYNSMLIAEAIRTAQKITGKKAVSGEDVRRGLEGLNVDAARLKEMGMEGFTGPIKLTCADHNGHRPTFVQRFDGTKYVKVSDWIEPMTDKVGALLKADAKAYAEKNAGWPARTEPCDSKS